MMTHAMVLTAVSEKQVNSIITHMCVLYRFSWHSLSFVSLLLGECMALWGEPNEPILVYSMV